MLKSVRPSDTKFSKVFTSSSSFESDSAAIARAAKSCRYEGAIRRSIGAEGRQLTERETSDLASLVKKMRDPFNSLQVDAPGGGKMLQLSDDDRALLKRTGTDNWYVPSEGTAWNKISRALIDGDGIDNYATPGGLSKIIQIRGPETGPLRRQLALRKS